MNQVTFGRIFAGSMAAALLVVGTSATKADTIDVRRPECRVHAIQMYESLSSYHNYMSYSETYAALAKTNRFLKAPYLQLSQTFHNLAQIQYGKWKTSYIAFNRCDSYLPPVTKTYTSTSTSVRTLTAANATVFTITEVSLTTRTAVEGSSEGGGQWNYIQR